MATKTTPTDTSTEENPTDELTVSREIAPEDIRIGDYVATLARCIEIPTFVWCSDATLVDRSKPVRVWFESISGLTCVYRVKAVCLPWILAKDMKGNFHQIDVRHCRLARINKNYAKRVQKSLRTR